MTQQQLPGVRVAPSSFSVAAQYDWRSGWSFRLSWRSSVDVGFSHRDYDGLIGAELVDVLSSELEQLVGGGRDFPSGGGDAAA